MKDSCETLLSSFSLSMQVATGIWHRQQCDEDELDEDEDEQSLLAFLALPLLRGNRSK